jgi:hypothetical protein
MIWESLFLKNNCKLGNESRGWNMWYGIWICNWVRWAVGQSSPLTMLECMVEARNSSLSTITPFNIALFLSFIAKLFPFRINLQLSMFRVCVVSCPKTGLFENTKFRSLEAKISYIFLCETKFRLKPTSVGEVCASLSATEEFIHNILPRHYCIYWWDIWQP